MDKKNTSKVQSANRLIVVDFLQAAFDDYLAARVLIRSKLLPQGVVLASTAIEKYCKAVLAAQGQSSPGRLKLAQWNCLQDFDAAGYTTFNKEFFLFLQKCFKLRYPDSLPVGFAIAIHSRELLAELDFTALSLQQQFKTKGLDTIISGRMPYNDLLVNKDKRLTDDNHLFKNEDRTAFVTRDDETVYELRKLANGALLQILYTSPPVASDGKFMREALKPTGDNRSFDLTLSPGMQKMIEAFCKNCGKMWRERIALHKKKLKFLDQAPVVGFIVNTVEGELNSIMFLMCMSCEPEKIAEMKRNAAQPPKATACF